MDSSSTQFVTATAAGGLLIGPSYQRKRIRLHNPTATRVTISTQPAPVLGNGYDLVNTQPDYDTGPEFEIGLAQKPHFAISAAGNVILGLVEVMGSP